MAYESGPRQIPRATAPIQQTAGMPTAGIGYPTAAAAAAEEYRGSFRPVPGMLGDRRANEFWFTFDNITLFEQPGEVAEAFGRIEQYFADRGVRNFVQTWMEMSVSPHYPADFFTFVSPLASPLRVLSGVRAQVIDSFYRRDDPRLVAAFADFGQGLLYDPRCPGPQRLVHLMAGAPPQGYHLWHALYRAMMLLDIDRPRWTRVARLNGLAWTLQSIAKPLDNEPNPPLPRPTVRREAARWLRLGPERLDAAFRCYPYPEGVR